MRKLLRGCIGLFLVVIIVGVILNLGSSRTPTANQGASNNTSAQSTTLGSRSNPYPLGQPGAIRDGRFQVNGLKRGQTATVEKSNMFNQTPVPGSEWMMANVTFFCDVSKDKTCVTTVMQIQLLGDLGNIYTSPFASVVDNPFTGEVFGGGQKTGNIGFVATSADKNMLVAVDDLGSRVFFKAE